MAIALASLLTIGVLVFIITVRTKDLPEPVPVSPFQQFDERKAAIYENLRDLQFEYRAGKLSDEDYQQSKTALQGELAGVLAEIDRVKERLTREAPAPTPVKTPQKYVCPHCKAEFKQALKFCGECGKPMKGTAA